MPFTNHWSPQHKTQSHVTDITSCLWRWRFVAWPSHIYQQKRHDSSLMYNMVVEHKPKSSNTFPPQYTGGKSRQIGWWKHCHHSHLIISWTQRWFWFLVYLHRFIQTEPYFVIFLANQDLFNWAFVFVVFPFNELMNKTATSIFNICKRQAFLITITIKSWRGWETDYFSHHAFGEIWPC